MNSLIDTDVAIHLRDGDAVVRARILDLPAPPVISLVSLIELKGGAMTGPHHELRRRRLDTILQAVRVIGLDEATVDVYAGFLKRSGFSRSRILDRLIAATAIVNDLTLVTMNGPDFRDIPGLKLEIWPSPTQ